MPETINGFGTDFCGYSSPVRWEQGGRMTRKADHDCVMAIVVFFLPIFPLRPLHTFD